MKTTSSAPDKDLHRVGANVELFVDANGAWSRKQALQAMERFADLGVTWVEEPVSSEDLEGLRLLRDRAPAGMEIATGEYGFLTGPCASFLGRRGPRALRRSSTAPERPRGRLCHLDPPTRVASAATLRARRCLRADLGSWPLSRRLLSHSWRPQALRSASADAGVLLLPAVDLPPACILEDGACRSRAMPAWMPIASEELRRLSLIEWL